MFCRVSWKSRCIASAAILSAILGQNGWCQQTTSPKPVVVVSLAPLSKLMPNIAYLTRAAGAPEANGFISMAVNGYTGGLDRKRPWGAYMYLDEAQSPVTVAYLPVEDREQFFTPLQAFAMIEDIGDNKFAVSGGPQTVYALQKDKWMFVAQDESHLNNVPADPTSIPGTLAEKYDVSVRLDLQHLPAEMRDMVLNSMRDGYESSMEQQLQGKSEAEQKATRDIGEQSMEQIKQAMTESEQVILGWAVDSSKKQTYFDMGTLFVQGSELEKQVVAQSKVATDFSAFQSPDASTSLRFTAPVSQDEVKRLIPTLRSQWANGISEMEKRGQGPAQEAFKSFFNDLLVQIEGALTAGIIDGGFSANVENGLELVGGGRVGDGNQLAGSLKKLLQQSPKDGAPTVKFDAYKHQDVTFHVGSLNVPSNAPDEAKKIFGSVIKFVIGTGSKSAYFALGNNCEAKLKAILDRKDAKSPITPVDFHVEMLPVLTFAQQVKANPQLDAAIEKLGDQDSIQLTARTVPRGVIYRLSLEEGILRAVGASVKAARAK